LDERERSFELVSPAPTIWRPEVGATRPTRSADGAVGVPVDTAPVLSMELCLPGSGGGVASRDAMSALQEAAGNACWLSSQCPGCIADGFRPSHIGSAGRSASRRLATRGDEFVEIAEGPPLLPRFTPAGNFGLCRCVQVLDFYRLADRLASDQPIARSKVRFAADSPQEQAGFELSVPP
jgi:hypothetical protein